jgi:hypothetical protein
MPVKKAARDGEHNGVLAKAFRKLAPSFASRLTLGVSAKGWPVQPNSSQRKSSTRIKITFGRGVSPAAHAPNGVLRNVRRDVILDSGPFRCASATFLVGCSVSTSRVYLDRRVTSVGTPAAHRTLTLRLSWTSSSRVVGNPEAGSKRRSRR